MINNKSLKKIKIMILRIKINNKIKIHLINRHKMNKILIKMNKNFVKIQNLNNLKIRMIIMSQYRIKIK